jgi:hypothetical protein
MQLWKKTVLAGLIGGSVMAAGMAATVLFSSLCSAVINLAVGLGALE